jgi:ADP-ribosyl-[dinitrogen reductase] hydrolase
LGDVSDSLQFPMIDDRFSEGSRVISPWVNSYLNFRMQNPDPSLAKQYLDSIGQNSSEIASKYRGCLIGLALGDALGATLEFSERDALPRVTNLVGGGPFNLKPGEWTDDTSMALCLAHSLLRKEYFSSYDQLELYTLWWKTGLFSVNGHCFDIGNTVLRALEQFELTKKANVGDPSPQAAGNGSLMRVAPAALFFLGDPEACVKACGASSKTTHKAPEAVDACRYFGGLIFGAILGYNKKELTTEVFEPFPGAWDSEPLQPSIVNVAQNAYKKSRNEIRSTGYVIDTLEAALWAFSNSTTFEEGAILAANLAGDSDTVAAVYGQLAGAYYGEYRIDPSWIRKLSRRHIFYVYADRLLRYGVCDIPPLIFKRKSP